MSRILALLILLASLGAASGQKLYTAVIEVTNVTQAGNALTNNGVYRYATNVQSATTWVTNLTSAAHASTNLWAQISLNRYAGQNVTPKTNATSVTLYSGSPILIGILGNWGYVTYLTNSGTNGYDLRLPFSTLPLTAATNQATDLSTGLVYSAHSPPTNAQFWANVMSRGVPFSGGIEQILAPKNFYSIAGTNAGLTNGPIEGARGTNLVGLHGTVYALSNGLYVTPILIHPATTNLTNYGLAISSPGSGTDSEQFGTGANATGTRSTAGGKNATASGTDSAAWGYQATASGVSSLALGTSASATGTNSSAIGAGSLAQETDSHSYGTGVENTHRKAIVIGNQVNSRETNDTLISNDTITLRGRVQIDGTVTTGDIALTRSDITTVAAGNNRINVGTNCFIRITGTPGAAWTLVGIEGGNRDGKLLKIYFNTGFNVTVAHQSGTEATAANRIISLTAADQTSTLDAAGEFIYDSGQSRWIMLQFSP
jgi:hypothetical protein